MMRRALTMLEILPAIVLLSAIVTATAAWTQIAAVAASPTGRVASERWIISANAVLDLIAQDTAVGDFNRRKELEAPRITIADSVLTIETRVSGRGTSHSFRFIADHELLSLTETTGSPGGGANESRPLLNNIGEWTCISDKAHRWFDVSITSLDGRTIERRYPLE